MRALLDANVLISYLLVPDGAAPPIIAVEAGLTGAFTLLMTSGVVAELRDKTATKPYLSARITPDQAERLVATLEAVAEIVPELDEPLPAVGRDRKDDYLFAHALVAGADYLVSGDKDVSTVRRIGEIQIVSPTEFVRVLQQDGLI